MLIADDDVFIGAWREGGGENRLAFRGSRGSVRDLKIRILVVSSSNSLFLNECNGDFVNNKKWRK